MLITVIVLVLLLFLAPPVKLVKPEEGDYLSKESSLPVKGFFVAWVFLSHFKNCVDVSGGGFLSDSFLCLMSMMGQLCVVMFLFFSGYGIYCSLCRKEDYMRSFLLKRLLPVWLSFAICVGFFFVENLILGVSFDPLHTALAFTGWTSIGNDNWYMFVTFALYIFAYLSFRFIKPDKRFVGLIVFTCLSFGLLVGLFIAKRDEGSCWYNTILCFPLGMWYAHFKDKIDAFIFRSRIRYFAALLVFFGLCVAGYYLSEWHNTLYCAYAPATALFMVMVMAKLRFRSLPLSFLGKHVFSIYILQKLVFRAGIAMGLQSNIYLFLVGSFAVTVVLAVGYDWLFNFVRGKLTRRKPA
jgi:membrane-bound acyltransferase YfiQ involved in biofilm formation